MRRLLLATVLSFLTACDVSAWLGDWCGPNGCEPVVDSGTGPIQMEPEPDIDGGGHLEADGGAPSREVVCEQMLWGCQWANPTQEAFFKPRVAASAEFGQTIALSGDGNTLVVGAPRQSEGGAGIDPPLGGNSKTESGAVFVYRRQSSTWVLQSLFKASNALARTQFGYSVTISSDGQRVAVGSPAENSNATGINGNQDDLSMDSAGAVYIFDRVGSAWLQTAYVKATNTGTNDEFGTAVALSGDGLTLAVGAPFEDGGSRAINGNQNDDSRPGAGAVYLYRLGANGWAPLAYVKAPNADVSDNFGMALALSFDGNTLVVGAPGEDGTSLGVNGDQSNNDGNDRGAAYIFERLTQNWSFVAYLKASVEGNTVGSALALSASGSLIAIGSPLADDPRDLRETIDSGEVVLFERRSGRWESSALAVAVRERHAHLGGAVALSLDGNTLLVGAWGEGGATYGANGDPSLQNASQSGAAYVFVRNLGGWTQMNYLKASNTRTGARFGASVALSGDASRLAMGSPLESTLSTGINGAQAPDTAYEVGAVYVWSPSR